MEILGTTGITQDEIEAQVALLVPDPMEARRLIEWIPEAFGMVVVSHMAKKTVLHQTFSARNAEGEWESIPFNCEPIFVAALKIAQSTYHCGPRELFKNIDAQSSILAVVGKVLDAGESIEGADLSGPAFIGIPAETYPDRPQPWWRNRSPIWQTFLSWICRRSSATNHKA